MVRNDTNSREMDDRFIYESLAGIRGRNAGGNHQKKKGNRPSRAREPGEMRRREERTKNSVAMKTRQKTTRNENLGTMHRKRRNKESLGKVPFDAGKISTNIKKRSKEKGKNVGKKERGASTAIHPISLGVLVGASLSSFAERSEEGEKTGATGHFPIPRSYGGRGFE